MPIISFLSPLPRGRFYLACSGGIDSMVFLDFLLRGKRKPILLYFNHGTEYGQKAEEFVKNQAKKHNLDLVIGRYEHVNSKQSQEEAWSNARNTFFHAQDGPVVTCHHLNDVAEWWIMSSCHGRGKLIPNRNGNVIRPFLITSRDDIVTWAKNHGIEWLEDPSNEDVNYSRNRVRHNVIPELLKVNPGLLTVLKKKIVKEFKKKNGVEELMTEFGGKIIKIKVESDSLVSDSFNKLRPGNVL